VGPQRNCHAAPFGQNRGMMAFILRQRGDPIGKCHGVGEVAKAKDSLEPRDPLTLDERPLRYLRPQLPYCRLGHAWRVAPAGGAFFLSKFVHETLLSNPIYIGEIRHRRERYPGQHEPVVSRELWEQVQLQLCSHAARTGEGRKTTASASPLAGKLFDENGEPLYVQGSAKGQRRYRYYVSKGLVNGAVDCAEAGWRLSATHLERDEFESSDD